MEVDRRLSTSVCMETMRQFQIYLLAAGLLLSGCREERRVPGVYVETDSPKTLETMAEKDVFVIVNGKSLNKGLFSTFCSLQEKLYRLHSAIALDRVSEKADGYRRRNEQRWYEELIRRELMRQEADRLNVMASTGMVDKAERRMMSFVRRPKNDFENLTNFLNGVEFDLLKQHLVDDVRSDCLRTLSATNDFETVTDEEVDFRIEDIRKFNERAEKLNAKSREKGVQFKADVLAGKGKFSALTKERAQVHPEFGEAWEDVQINEYPEDSPLHIWLKTAAPGDISDPIDLDDGLAVVGFVALLDADVPEGVPPIKLYRLVRCTFYAYEKTEEKSRDEVRKMIKAEKRDAVQKELGSRIFDAAVIEFPHGTDLFPKVQKAPQSQVPEKPVEDSISNNK